ncbi:ABC transporter permease [Pararhizobium sp. IMCC21322]|uniref:ABC transporter permease n=1 Tax=Pararhizobium sp. IMCC21322 TaxID=3067903 RepID=UPI002741CCB3|nr:ABC transporter permease [Pararhizobium sp. IMCC21322]
MSAPAMPQPIAGSRRAGLSLRFALRELRGGLKGFYIFLACLALGVTAIAGVGSVSRSLSEGISQGGNTILGGDISFELVHREAAAEELAYIKALGKVSQIATTRAMARRSDGADQTLVELKAVDGLYPLTGTVETASGADFASLLAPQSTADGQWGALAAPELLARLDLAVGDTLQIGDLTVLITDTLTLEPDRLSTGFGFGPRLMLSEPALRDSGLIQPGSLMDWVYRVNLPANGNSDADLKRIEADAEEKFPLAGWDIDTRNNASPGLRRNIERFAQFLTLVGLTALVVGGVGIANAVRAYLDTKQKVIATFKSVGASGGFVFRIYLFQIMVLALVGIAIGLVAGAAIPFLASGFLRNVLPVETAMGIYPQELALAVLYGVLTTLVFALWPLGKIQDISPTALFRDGAGAGSGLPGWPYLIAFLASAVALASAAIFLSYDPFIATVFVGACAAAFILLRVVAEIIMAIAKRVPRPKSTPWRLAIGNLHRKGALTPSVVLSLGLGLALLVCLTLIDSNLRRQLSSTIAEQAPSFFFVDIQNDDLETFKEGVRAVAPTGDVQSVPMLRGRMMSLAGVPVSEIEAPPGSAWALRGDRGITYSATMPDNSKLTEGEWWPADYEGKPLVSYDSELAGEFGLKIGDEVSVNVLGREITAEIANLREVEWETLAINFVLVFSPNTFAGAPHTHLATLTYPEGSTEDAEFAVLKSITSAFPAVTSVRVKDALDQANEVIGQLALAVRVAASIALVASILVLGGALAAGQRHRVYDAVILKTLGATRRQLIQAFGLEYLLLGTVTAVFGLIAGSAASWFVLERIMGADFTFLPSVAFSALLTALVLTVGFGLAGTWRLLGQKAAPVLREL